MISVKRLERARSIAAIMVRDMGETYLPIYMRLEQECAARQKTRGALDRALAAADSYKAILETQSDK